MKTLQQPSDRERQESPAVAPAAEGQPSREPSNPTTPVIEAPTSITCGGRSYELHPICAAFPRASEKDLEQLAESLKKQGQHHPVLVAADGRVLDGASRLRACEIAGLTPWVKTWDGDGDPAEAALDANLVRRRLTHAQKAIVASRLATLRPGRPGANAQGCAITLEAAAKRLGVSRRAVQQARRVQDEDDDRLLKVVERGRWSLTLADRFVAAPVQQRDQVRALLSDATSGAASDTRKRALEILKRRDVGGDTSEGDQGKGSEDDREEPSAVAAGEGPSSQGGPEEPVAPGGGEDRPSVSPAGLPILDSSGALQHTEDAILGRCFRQLQQWTVDNPSDDGVTLTNFSKAFAVASGATAACLFRGPDLEARQTGLRVLSALHPDTKPDLVARCRPVFDRLTDWLRTEQQHASDGDVSRVAADGNAP
jgi:hypothetical protein